MKLLICFVKITIDHYNIAMSVIIKTMAVLLLSMLIYIFTAVEACHQYYILEVYLLSIMLVALLFIVTVERPSADSA